MNEICLFCSGGKRNHHGTKTVRDATQRVAYRTMLRPALPEATLGAIRHATNRAWPFGGDRFKEELARLTARRVGPPPASDGRHRSPMPRNQGIMPL